MAFRKATQINQAFAQAYQKMGEVYTKLGPPGRSPELPGKGGRNLHGPPAGRNGRKSLHAGFGDQSQHPQYFQFAGHCLSPSGQVRGFDQNVHQGPEGQSVRRAHPLQPGPGVHGGPQAHRGGGHSGKKPCTSTRSSSKPATCSSPSRWGREQLEAHEAPADGVNGRAMSRRSSIFMKILVVILPLVGVPIVIVGYFSVRTSADRVNRLVRQEQQLLLEAAAARINPAAGTDPDRPGHPGRPAGARRPVPGPVFPAVRGTGVFTKTASCAFFRTLWPAARPTAG